MRVDQEPGQRAEVPLARRERKQPLGDAAREEVDLEQLAAPVCTIRGDLISDPLRGAELRVVRGARGERVDEIAVRGVECGALWRLEDHERVVGVELGHPLHGILEGLASRLCDGREHR